MKQRSYLYAFLSAMLFGISTPLSKLLLDQTNPILLASLFYLGAAVFLIPVGYKEFSREIKHIKGHRKDLLRLIGATVFGGILGPICLLYGIDMVTATTASLLLNLETVATTVLAWMFFKEHISKQVLISCLLTVIAGSILVIGQDVNFTVGCLLILLGCICWGLDNNFTAAVEGVSPVTNTIFKGLIAGTFNGFLALQIYSLGDLSFSTILFAAIIGFLAYGLSITLYITAAREMGASRSQIIFATNPFLGALASYLIFFNPLDWTFFVAVTVMIASLLVLFREHHHHEHTHNDEEHEHEHTHDDGHHDHSHEGLPANTRHTHKHRHTKTRHDHPHYPDIHHRHKH